MQDFQESMHWNWCPDVCGEPGAKPTQIAFSSLSMETLGMSVTEHQHLLKHQHHYWSDLQCRSESQISACCRKFMTAGLTETCTPIATHLTYLNVKRESNMHYFVSSTSPARCGIFLGFFSKVKTAGQWEQPHNSIMILKIRVYSYVYLN